LCKVQKPISISEEGKRSVVDNGVDAQLWLQVWVLPKMSKEI